ncbi:hypothetical protein [Sinosporangium siamense]|uniref:Uncharacterized protein n=1 Tax=Sinosporangium siamense TaxID=1367973 RepID=A0A919V7V6_9ACTN|nr:hypothetical protein [Sinosporangium siamense]GII95520.1 hypothetical protein Ssi02_57510 [Sinosporangium siamense]
MKFIAATAAAVIFLFAPAAAHAGTSRAAHPTPADLAAALAAAIAAKDTVVAFFTAQGAPPGQIPVEIIRRPLVVNELDPAFVANRSWLPGRFSFIAVGAKGPGNLLASLWMSRTAPGTWKLGNIAGGDTEQRYAGQGPPGAVFREPQLGAWYVIRGHRVVPLNEQATASVGASGVSLAEYRRIVQSRYADRLPGSDYDRRGQAGGHDQPAKAAGKPAATESEEQSAVTQPKTKALAAPMTAESGAGLLPWVAGAGVLLAAMVAIRFLRAT